uniref:Uncharacterized protein LOC104218146 isoform X2 n=1 Tax=Nicotiana sylvestris TaxID=4096 RepID=A0A1U7VXZ4_NICSY|nr:PREDICTED: uncharacterized protein LOC104218146 isoform X2 [Nicotiana sylvestris]
MPACTLEEVQLPLCKAQSHGIPKKLSDDFLHGEKKKAAMQLKRRDTYNQISPVRRDALLLSRRMRKQDTARHNLAENADVAVSEQPTSSLYKVGFQNKLRLPYENLMLFLKKVTMLYSLYHTY